MSDKKETPNKLFVIFSSLTDYPRWKSYTMSELRQQGCNWTIIKKERTTIKTIQEDLIKKGFTAAQLTPNIFINTMLYGKEKYDKSMSKAEGIISKLVSDQQQPIIERNTPQEALTLLQEPFQ